MAHVLIVDDDPGIRTHLATHLQDLGHEPEAAADAMAALAAMGRRPFEAVLSDVRMAGMDGFAFLRELRGHHPDAGVVLMTAYATVPDAVEAIRGGAYDYLVKPFSLEQVDHVLARLLEVQSLRRENRSLRDAVEGPPLLESRNPAMRRVLERARLAAASDTTILVSGESGVGKNVLAAAIHRWSPRADGPFVTVACTSLVDDRLDSEIFGHMRGAFAGAWRDKAGGLEAAGGGTAFLDDVADLPADLQAKLLRFLEARHFERLGSADTLTATTRVIAATSRELADEVREQRFREDLFHRLNVIALRLPALRERREDLPALTDHLLKTLSVRHARPGLVLTPAARRALESYSWPGNLRELWNALERAVVLARRARLDADDLPDHVLTPVEEPRPSISAAHGSLAELERAYVQRVLAECATLEEAAARLGINATTLWRKRKRWGLD
jgi:DNA-binding NtrC family response regulator